MAKYLLEGTAVSPGIATGAIVISDLIRDEEKRILTQEEIPQELEALSNASQSVYKELQSRLATLPADMIESRELIEAQMELAKDSRILDGALARIVMRKICAAWALTETIEELISLFRDIQDSSVAERVQDIQAIGDFLKDALENSGQRNKLRGILAVPQLTPTLILRLKNPSIKGIVTVEGTATTHAIILAKSLNIPVITNLSSLFEYIRNGQQAIIDGYTGKLYLEPSKQEVKEYARDSKLIVKLEESIRFSAKNPVQTRDGNKIIVKANVESPSQIGILKASGAEGIGLYRTEFSFLGPHIPGEDSLQREYARIINGAPRNNVIIRTLDIGADKKIGDLQQVEEENPALGLRGIRFCLKNKELFKMQLRAIMKACKKNKAGIMLPMISTVEEFLQTRQIVDQVHRTLEKEGVEHIYPLSLGIMIETPAAVLISSKLAKHCDFFSIGTNDLLHYLLAIDRNNRHVAYLHDPFHPAFLTSLTYIVKNAREYNIPVSVCGELASDPYGVILLLGAGIKILSITPLLVPALKYLVRKLDLNECREVVTSAMKTGYTKFIRKKLQKIIDQTEISMACFPLKPFTF